MGNFSNHYYLHFLSFLKTNRLVAKWNSFQVRVALSNTLSYLNLSKQVNPQPFSLYVTNIVSHTTLVVTHFP